MLCVASAPRDGTMSTVRFTLNGRPIEVSDLPGTTTLLRYLRDHLGLMGTKEGCAEGDCGACTVAVLEARDGDTPVWRAVDACLVFLPMVHGKQVVTVEGLRDRDGAHHLVQEAVVGTVMRGGDTDTNAAICGALLGAVHGKGAVPAQWVESLLNCRPESGQPHVRRPRPECFWPIDALELAERLLVRDQRDIQTNQEILS